MRSLAVVVGVVLCSVGGGMVGGAVVVWHLIRAGRRPS